MSNNAHDLSNRLLNALDNSYNVVDMHAVNEIISILEKINITKELLETTRLGKHVNELRRKTSDPTLARRAKVLVKRWRDLVIPSVASPGHTGSNRSSAERQVRRLGGTPLTSPALSRVVSPAVNSPRPPSRPAWGGYESDSQDVILVDDDPPAPPPPPPAAHKPLTPPVKRPTSPVPLHDEKKAKRDKKPKKRRGHSRAGSGTETPTGPGTGPWPARNGSAQPDRRRNGYKRDHLEPYAALVNRMPPAGAKKVKTTQELLEEIQSRGSRAAASPSPSPPASPASPDVMLIEPDAVKAESPLRNGAEGAAGAGRAPPSPRVPLEDERPAPACCCDELEPDPQCPAAARRALRPRHVHALHHALWPGVNGTRAPLPPDRFAVRAAEHPAWPGLFASVVPLYRYSDHADDYCAKNMSRVPLCAHLPWTEWAPAPPDPPPPPEPPAPRPYPPPEPEPEPAPAPQPQPQPERPPAPAPAPPAPVPAPPAPAPGERLKPPLLSAEEERQLGLAPPAAAPAPAQFASAMCAHRTVERAKATGVDGRALAGACAAARAAAPWSYAQLAGAAEAGAALDDDGALAAALEAAAAATRRDALQRPLRPARFAEWHECARLGDLLALPYVVID